MLYLKHFPPISYLFPYKVCMPSQALHQFLFSCEPDFQDNKDWCLSSYHRVLLSKKYRAKSTVWLSWIFQISLSWYICTLCWKISNPSWWSSLFSHMFMVNGVYLTIFTTDSKPSAQPANTHPKLPIVTRPSFTVHKLVSNESRHRPGTGTASPGKPWCGTHLPR